MPHSPSQFCVNPHGRIEDAGDVVGERTESTEKLGTIIRFADLSEIPPSAFARCSTGTSIISDALVASEIAKNNEFMGENRGRCGDPSVMHAKQNLPALYACWFFDEKPNL